MRVQSLASLSGLRIRCGCQLQCRSLRQQKSYVAVAVVQTGSCSSGSTPSLGTSICHKWGPKKKKKELRFPYISFSFKKKKEKNLILLQTDSSHIVFTLKEDIWPCLETFFIVTTIRGQYYWSQQIDSWCATRYCHAQDRLHKTELCSSPKVEKHNIRPLMLN